MAFVSMKLANRGSVVDVISMIIAATIIVLRRVSFCMSDRAKIALQSSEIRQIQWLVICVIPAVMAVYSIKYIITIPICRVLLILGLDLYTVCSVRG